MKSIGLLILEKAYDIRFGWWCFFRAYDWWLLYLSLKGFPEYISARFWDDLNGD